MATPRYRAQLATLAERPPSGSDWLHELKYDGYRIGCSVEDGRVRLESRRNHDWTAQFPEIALAVKRLPVSAALLDGEVAIVLPDGRTSFQALQSSFSGAPRQELTFFVFDLLHLDGRDLVGLPLEQRKQICESLIRRMEAGSAIRYSQHFEIDGATLLARACALGAEGIVSKRRDQPYRPGRNDGWLKSKCGLRQELVIGGFTDPQASRRGIGALLVGYYEGDLLRYGGKVGTGKGFTAEYLERVRRELAAIERKESPFVPPPAGWLGKNAHWVAPVRSGEVVFTEWTQGGHVRHGSFQGFRDDKAPGDIHREHAAPKAAVARALEADAGARVPTSGVLAKRPARGALSVGGVTITTPTRPVYPGLGFTKLDLAQFYFDVADWMLPYIANRPLTLVRCERGVRGVDALRSECKFLPHEPGWYRWASAPIRRFQIQEQKKLGEYLVVDSREGLIALAQGDITEIHVWNSTVDRLEQPDRIVFDLDPGAAVAWRRVVDAALAVRDALTTFGLQSWPKLTGGKGVHVVLPFEPDHSWDEVYELSHKLAELFVQRYPEWLTLDFAKQGRSGKILVDYKRNHRAAVAVAAYSTRARPSGAVGVPLSWRELSASRAPDQWTVQNLRQRLQRLRADPWRKFWTQRQRLARP